MRTAAVHSIIILCTAMCFISCARGSTREAMARLKKDTARAAQLMSIGAQFGADVIGSSQYRERDPNPNAYVGELLYMRYCGGCHGSGKGPQIQIPRAADAESDYYIIRYGLRSMPSFRSKLTTFQTYDILKYMGDDLETFLKKDVDGAQN